MRATPFLAMLLWATCAYAQSPQQNATVAKAIYYSGSAVQYICEAATVQAQSSFAVTSVTTASEAVFTVSGGHNVYYVSATERFKPAVTLSGGTVDWAVNNAKRWILVPQSTTTFKLYAADTGTVLDSSGYASGAGTYTVTTTAPLLNQAVWKLTQFGLDSSGNTTSIQNANGGSRSAKCSDRAAAYIAWN